MTTVTFPEMKKMLTHAVNDSDAWIELTLFKIKFKLFPSRINVDLPMRRRRVNRRWVEEPPSREDLTFARMKLFAKFLMRLTREASDDVTGEVRLRRVGISFELGVESDGFGFDSIWVPCDIAGFDAMSSEATVQIPGENGVAAREALRRIVL